MSNSDRYSPAKPYDPQRFQYSEDYRIGSSPTSAPYVPGSTFAHSQAGTDPYPPPAQYNQQYYTLPSSPAPGAASRLKSEGNQFVSSHVTNQEVVKGRSN